MVLSRKVASYKKALIIFLCALILLVVICAVQPQLSDATAKRALANVFQWVVILLIAFLGMKLLQEWMQEFGYDRRANIHITLAVLAVLVLGTVLIYV